MITKEALGNKYANKEHELCLYEFVVVIVLDYPFQCLDYIGWIRLWNEFGFCGGSVVMNGGTVL